MVTKGVGLLKVRAKTVESAEFASPAAKFFPLRRRRSGDGFLAGTT
jgi:hypothetical protein